MKLVMTLVVRDEADIIRANLDYHLANGVDFAIVTDHGSSDGTSEILHEYERAGHARVIRDEDDGHHQSRRVTRMAELARSEHHATWVMHNDADEFWWPQVGSLRDVFAALPERYVQVLVPRRNFRPLAEHGSLNGSPFHQRLVYRELRSQRLEDQPKVAHRPLPGLVVAPGNHSLHPPDLPCVPQCGLLEIFHFPMRSFEQFERKVLQTGLGYERVSDLSPGVGSEQLQLLALAREGRLREHYERHVLDEDSLQADVAQGAVVLDRRLADFMREVSAGAPTPSRVGEPHARELLDRLMGALGEVERRGEQLQEAHADNVLLVERLEAMHADAAELCERLERANAELASVSEALHLLRTSRLMRHTRWARRLYYGLARAGAVSRPPAS
jgi:hypothetical protein